MQTAWTWPALQPHGRSAQHWAVVVCLSLPWVVPFSLSPLANVVPWLISWTGLALALLMWRHMSALAIAQSWAIAALLSSVVGLVQYVGAAEAWAPLLHVPAYLGDAVGNLRQRNQLATLLAMGTLAVCWWSARGLPLIHAAWMQSLLAIGLAATASRTGLLQIIVVWLWVMGHRLAPPGRNVGWLALSSLGMYAIASVLLPWCLQQLSGQVADNAMVRMASLGGCGSRQVLWSNVWQLIAQHPLTGWGWDNLRYAHYITAYDGPRFCDLLGHAHNLPLHLAFVWGLPVAGVLVLGLVVWVWRSRPWRQGHPDTQLAWGVIAIIGLHSLLEYPLWYGPFQVAAVCVAWILGGQIAVALRAPNGPPVVAVLMLVLLGVGAYDFAQVRQIYLPAAQRWPVWRHNALEVAQRTWFFSGTALFAEVTTTRLSQDNARWLFEASQQLLHHSPEPRVIEQLLASAQWLGEDATYQQHLQRYQDAYPEAYQSWMRRTRPAEN